MNYVRRTTLAIFLASFSLAGCGGGGTTTGGLPPSPISPGATATPAPGDSATPVVTPPPGASPTPTPAPGSSTTPTATPKPTPTATPVGTKPTATPAATATPVPSPTPINTGNTLPPPSAPPDAPGHSNVVPPIPAGSACRAGTSYDIYVTSPATDISPSGSTEAFTVFEPSMVCGNKTYPLIFNGPGFGGSRTSAAGSFSQFTSQGYGVISVDEAGEGNDGGKIRVMDPDQEGRMLLSVLDWAQVKLKWLAFGPTNDGKDSHEPIYGSEGGSYGGMYQFMLLNVDKRHRLRAIVPQITPADLNFSLFPGGVIKTLWNAELFAIGNSAGNGTSRAQFDPFVNNVFVNDDASNTEDPFAHDFFGYHSVDYFCNGTSIATNGGAGTRPALPATTAPPKINALIWIGIRDTLFDFTNGFNNYNCMKRGGGDVRLLSYQSGHNSLGTVPDPYVNLYYPPNDDMDSRCGKLAEADSELAWFNTYLKGQSGAISMIPKNPCISFAAGDGVTIPTIPTNKSGPTETPFDIGNVSVVSGNPGNPTAVALFTSPQDNFVEAGIPHVSFNVTTVSPLAGTPIFFVGVGQLHASNPAAWDLVDNQVMPVRGLGKFDIDLTGQGARLAKGDKLGLLFFGLNNQFASNGNISVGTPAADPLTITGSVDLPLLGQLPANI